jgi:hypothetical protein
MKETLGIDLTISFGLIPREVRRQLPDFFGEIFNVLPLSDFNDGIIGYRAVGRSCDGLALRFTSIIQ